MMKVTEGVVNVIVYSSAWDKLKNRGLAFIEYDSDLSAATARSSGTTILCQGHNIVVD